MDAATARGARLRGRRPCARAAPRARPRSSRSSASSASATAPTSARSRSPRSTSRTAQRVFDAPGRRSTASTCRRDARRADGRVQARLERALGGRYDVLTASEAIEQVGEPVRNFLGFFTVRAAGLRRDRRRGRRVRDLQHLHDPRDAAHARARAPAGHGRDGGQVVWSVVLEALVVGAIASVLGLAARHRARGRAARVAAHDRARSSPRRPPCCSAGRSWCRSRSACSSLSPPRCCPRSAAARVPPVAAIDDVPPRAARRVPPPGRRRAGRHRRRAPPCSSTGSVARRERQPACSTRSQVVALGAFGVLVGVVMLLATVARPLAGAVGLAAARARHRAARSRAANAMRNPRRTAVTASALVIGLALVGLTATFGASAKASVGHDTGAGLRADYVVKSDGFAGFSGDVADAAARPARSSDAVVPHPLRRRRDRRRRQDGRRRRPRRLEQGGRPRLRERRHRRPRPGRDPRRRRPPPAPTASTTGDTVALQLSRGSSPLAVRGVYRNENFIGIFGQSMPLLVSERRRRRRLRVPRRTRVVLVTAKPASPSAARRADGAGAGRRLPEHHGAHPRRSSATSSWRRSTSSSPCSSRSSRCRRSSPSSAS